MDWPSLSAPLASVPLPWRVLVAVLVVVASASVLWRPQNRGEEPPLASPSVPVLGNALHYKAAPCEYIRRQAKIFGGVFQMNLAGFRTTLVADKVALKQFALATEKVLSARDAVADFGFRETLGELNVFVGTDIHKLLLKD